MKLAGQFSSSHYSAFRPYTSQLQTPSDQRFIHPLSQRSVNTISAALGRDLPDYHVRTTSHGLEASNSHGALTTHFTATGVQVTSGTLRWAMTLRGYGYGDAIEPVAKASPQANQNRVEYRRGPLTEWYENGPVGLEQGFTLTEPQGERNGKPLTIEIEVLGNSTLNKAPMARVYTCWIPTASNDCSTPTLAFRMPRGTIASVARGEWQKALSLGSTTMVRSTLCKSTP